MSRELGSVATTALFMGDAVLGGCANADHTASAAPDPDVVFASLVPGILLASEDFDGWTLAERMASS